MKWNLRMSAFACAIGLVVGVGRAEETTIGLTPCDGVNMFAKEFSVQSGTVITGATFSNNDDETVFPAVILVRGGTSSLGEGTVLRTASNVSEAGGQPGVVTVTWSTPVTVSEAGMYYVAVRPPEGLGKQAAGNGPGIGASRVDPPAGSFLATGAGGELIPIGVDLDIALLASGGGVGKSRPTPASTTRTYLGDPKPNPFNPATDIEFGLERRAATRLTIYSSSGRVVRALVDEARDPGVYRETWDGRDDGGARAATGVYFVRLLVDSALMQKKLVLVK